MHPVKQIQHLQLVRALGSLIYDKYSVVTRVYEVLPCATSTSLVNAAKLIMRGLCYHMLRLLCVTYGL
jgi:hypothetical protein